MAPSKKGSMHIFENRLASFTVPHQRRRSSTAKSKKADPLTWPHPEISIEKLAKAGLFYQPTVGNQDNCVCYLCDKALAGWEEDDDPALEHAHHAPFCGWARIHATMVKRNRNKNTKIEDPKSEEMTNARIATFGKWWPHTRQARMPQVEALSKAGFHYFATNSTSPDNVACSYCELELDGWEEGDNPWDEHLKRSRDCIFFTWTEPKKPRASRTSMVSTVVSDRTKVTGDDSPQDDGSVKKKVGKGGKASKASRPTDDKVPEDERSDASESKPRARSRKRSSSLASIGTVNDPSEKPAKKPRARSSSRARTQGKARSSISRGTKASRQDEDVELQVHGSGDEVLDDKEIERRLLEDLDRQQSEDEGEGEVEPGLSSDKATHDDLKGVTDPPEATVDADQSVVSKRGKSDVSGDDEAIAPPKKRGRVRKNSRGVGVVAEETAGPKPRSKKTDATGKSTLDPGKKATGEKIARTKGRNTKKVAAPEASTHREESPAINTTTQDLQELRVDPDGGVVLFDGGGESDSSADEIEQPTKSGQQHKDNNSPLSKSAAFHLETNEKQAEDESALIEPPSARPEKSSTHAATLNSSVPDEDPPENALALVPLTPPGQLTSKNTSTLGWAPIDIDSEFGAISEADASPSNVLISKEECDLTVAEWVRRNALRSEAKVIRVCENTVNMLNTHSRRALDAVQSM